MVRTTNEKISIVRENMKIAQHRQKRYVDKRHKDLEFEVGDHMFLKVSPIQGVVRFGQKRGKLLPHYIGPFNILKRVGKMVYRLTMPPKMSGFHNVFHISMLRKCMHANTQVIKFDDINVRGRVS